MKIKYNEILNQYDLLYEDLPVEVKETIELSKEYKDNHAFKEILQSILQADTQYKTYTHS